MKKTLLFFSICWMGYYVSAQGLPKYPVVQAIQNTPVSFDKTHRAGGDTIWINHFDNPADWIAAGSSTDFEEWGWSIGDSTNSWHFANQDMGTGGVFARFRNGDASPSGIPAPIEDGPFTLTCTSVLDLSAVTSPHIEFEQFGARYFEFQGVQISTDNGASWTTVGDNMDIPNFYPTGGNPFPKPQTRRFNISSAISADPSQVMIRLYWDGHTKAADTNYTTYGWYVDNMRIVEGFNNDLSLKKARYGSGTLMLEYPIVNQSFNAPVHFYGVAQNNGTTAQNVALNIDISGGTTLNQTGTPIVLNPGQTDTTGFVSWNPWSMPIYSSATINYTIQGDSLDENPMDNHYTRVIRKDNYVFARDEAGMNYNSPVFDGYISNMEGNEGEPFIVGNIFEIISPFPQGFRAIDVGIHHQNVPANNLTLYGMVFKLNPVTQEFEYITETLEFYVYTQHFGRIIPLICFHPVTADPGDVFLIMAAHWGSALGGGQTDIKIATSGQSPEGSVLMSAYFPSLQFYAPAAPPTPVIRINTGYWSIEEHQNEYASLGQNYPNPAAEVTHVPYKLMQTAEVQLEITDLTGKVLYSQRLGTQFPGEYTHALNLTGLAGGIYFYTLVSNGERMSKKMVVR